MPISYANLSNTNTQTTYKEQASADAEQKLLWYPMRDLGIWSALLGHDNNWLFNLQMGRWSTTHGAINCNDRLVANPNSWNRDLIERVGSMAGSDPKEGMHRSKWQEGDHRSRRNLGAGSLMAKYLSSHSRALYIVTGKQYDAFDSLMRHGSVGVTRIQEHLASKYEWNSSSSMISSYIHIVEALHVWVISVQINRRSLVPFL